MLQNLEVKITADPSELQRGMAGAKASIELVNRAAKTATGGTGALSGSMGNLGAASGNLQYQIRGVTQQLSQVGQQTMATGQFVQALAIQLPDIGLAFGAVGTAAGLLAGIALPMVMPAFSDNTERSNELADALNRVSEALEQTKDIAELTVAGLDALSERYGQVTSDVLALVEAQRNIGLRELSDAANVLNDALVNMYNGNAWLNVSRAEELSSALGLSTSASYEFAASLKALSQEQTLDGQLRLVSEMQRRFVEMVGPVGEMTKAQYRFYISLVDSNDKMRETKKRTEEVKKGTKDLKEESENVLAAIGNITKAWGAAQSGIDGNISRANDLSVVVGNLAKSAWNYAEAMSAAKNDASQGFGPSVTFGSGDVMSTFTNPILAGLAPQGEDVGGFFTYPGGGSSSRGGGGGGGGAENPILAELEAVKEALKTEAEMIQETYAEQIETLQSAYEQRKLTQEEFQDWSLRSKQEYEDAMTEIERAKRDATLSGYEGMFGDLSSLMQSKNEKMFKIGKAAAIAEALVSGYRSAVKAWEKGMEIGGPPVAAAFSAASAIKTGMLVSQISSQSIGGGSGAGGGGGGGASAGAAAPTVTETRTANINFYGGFQPTQESISMIATGLNSWLGDGGKLNVGAT